MLVFVFDGKFACLCCFGDIHWRKRLEWIARRDKQYAYNHRTYIWTATGVCNSQKALTVVRS